RRILGANARFTFLTRRRASTTSITIRSLPWRKWLPPPDLATPRTLDLITLSDECHLRKSVYFPSCIRSCSQMNCCTARPVRASIIQHGTWPGLIVSSCRPEGWHFLERDTL